MFTHNALEQPVDPRTAILHPADLARQGGARWAMGAGWVVCPLDLALRLHRELGRGERQHGCGNPRDQHCARSACRDTVVVPDMEHLRQRAPPHHDEEHHASGRSRVRPISPEDPSPSGAAFDLALRDPAIPDSMGTLVFSRLNEQTGLSEEMVRTTVLLHQKDLTLIRAAIERLYERANASAPVPPPSLN